MALQFYLTTHARKNGEHTIRVSVHIANTRLQTTIGITVNPDFWHDGKQKVKKGTINSKGMKFNEINDKLASIVKAFTAFENDNNGAPTKLSALKEILHNSLYGEIGKPMRDKYSFYETYDMLVAKVRVECQWSESTIKKYGTFRKHLQSFAPKTRFAEWDKDMINRFIVFEGKKLKMMDSSIQKDVKMLKWFLRGAMEVGAKVPADFLNFRYKFKLIEKEVVFLTWDELIRLYNFEVPEEGTVVRLKDISGLIYKKEVRNRSSLLKTRDLFCFCAFTGLRYSDMAALKRTDVISDFINVIT